MNQNYRAVKNFMSHYARIAVCVILLALSSGCSSNVTRESPSGAIASASPSQPGSSSVSDRSPGSVTITYILSHIPKIASNQIAVWIEDESGNYVRTLYVTRFTASGGYKQRPESIPLWIKTSDWTNASKNEVDAVTGATQKPGVITLTWDCKDKDGQSVKPGKYVYIIEGNIYWNDRVVWRGEIEVGNEENTSLAKAEYIPQTAKDSGILIENVSAVFTLAK
jgi:hypothetical protein